MNHQRGGGTLQVLPEVRQFVEQFNIGRVESDRIVLLCQGRPIRWLEPPSRFNSDEMLGQGLGSLMHGRPKPRVAFIQALHT
ncbi:MAG TPA: hypothetical protein VFT87_00100, partial [Candidatus Saccharimonadales bacterium]|nr:hypothetical protein [Candidatus Saccharimonadales bacterium]